MPDSPVSPAPAAAESNATPGDFPKAQLETVKNSETLARSATKEEHLTLLISEGMLAPTPAELLRECTSWRKWSGEAVDATEERIEITAIGDDAETTLQQEVEYYRGKCRLAITQHPEWSDAQKAALKARYFINSDIFSNEATAGQSVRLLLDHAAEDNLPGVKLERLTASAQLLKNFTGNPGPQTDAQTFATMRRKKRDLAFAEVMRLRQQIQFSANAAYPWWKDENIAFRREFLLPVGRPFTA